MRPRLGCGSVQVGVRRVHDGPPADEFCPLAAWVVPNRYVVLAMPRTGSSRLIEALRQHPLIVANGEVLNSNRAEWAWAHRARLSSDEMLQLGFTKGPWDSRKVTVLAAGFKVLDEQVAPGSTYEYVLTALARDSSIKVIYLERENLMESLRSYLQAKATGEWQLRRHMGGGPPPPVRVSPSSCDLFFRRAVDFDHMVTRTFHTHTIRKVTYEEMQQSPHQVIAGLHAFLGVPTRQLSPETLVKQEQRHLSETLENFEELKAHFTNTPFARFFGTQT